jgi:putative PIN family toxin of toxin-antitoxin system
MKVVIDTNILVSAILKGRLPRTVIQFVIESNKIEWIVSEAILTEYKDVVSRPKFKLSEGVIREWYRIFDTVPRLIDVHSTVDFPRDRSDAKFLGEHPNYVMSINAQKGKKAFVITILVPITQFREPLKIYELPKRLAI